MLLRFLGYHGNKFQNLKVIKVADYGIHCLLDDEQCLIIKFLDLKHSLPKDFTKARINL